MAVTTGILSVYFSFINKHSFYIKKFRIKKQRLHTYIKFYRVQYSPMNLDVVGGPSGLELYLSVLHCLNITP